MTTTPNLGLYKPIRGEVGWDDEINANFDVLDAQLGRTEGLWTSVTASPYDATGLGTADDTAACQAAIDAANAAYVGTGLWQTVYFPQGTYKISQLILKPGVDLITDSARLLKSLGATSTNAVATSPTQTTTTTLSADAAVGAETVTVTSAAGFAAGDWVNLQDATYDFGASGHNEEINQIEGIVGTTVTLKMKLIGSYATASTAQMVKIENAPHFSRVQGFRIDIPDGANGGGVAVTRTAYMTVSDCEFSGFADEPAVSFNYAAHSAVQDCIMRDGQNLAGGGYAYGAQGWNSHHILVSRIRSDRIREHPLSANSRFWIVDSCVMRNHYDDGVNSHGAGVDYAQFSNNVVTNTRGYALIASFESGNKADSQIVITNNSIYQNNSTGILVQGVSTSDRVSQVLVSNNYIDWLNNYGILIEFAQRVTVVGNHLRMPSATYGMIVDESNDINIRSNTIVGSNSADSGMLLLNTTDKVTIEENTFLNNASVPVDANQGTHTDLVIRNNINTVNQAPALTSPPGAGTIMEGNRWGTLNNNESEFRVDQNTATIMRVRNGIALGNTSASARAEFSAVDASGYIGAFPSDATAGPGVAAQDKLVVGLNSDASAIALFAGGASQVIDFYSGSSTKVAQVNSSGIPLTVGKALIAGTSTDNGRIIAGDSSAGYAWYVERNLTGGGGVMYINRHHASATGAHITLQNQGAGNLSMRMGAGSPEGAVSANVGSLYMRSDGGNGTSLYVKTSGTGNTGWRAVQDAAP